MTPFFSIIIPTYNRANFITYTIDSLLKQSYRDFEIIVVDDGSTDNTEEVMKEITDSRVSYYKKENGERGIARNFGAKLAKGDYLNFFDSDDLAYNNHLQTAADFISDKKSPEVFHMLYDTQIDGKIEPTKNNFSPLVNDVLIRENILSCNNVMLRKDIALKHPFPEDRRLAVAEDWALWLQLASRYSFHHYPILTSTIIYHDNRSVFDFNADKIILRDQLLLEYLWRDSSFLSYYKRSLAKFRANRYVFMALFLAIKNRKSESIGYLKKAIESNWSSLGNKQFWGTIKTLLFK